MPGAISGLGEVQSRGRSVVFVEAEDKNSWLADIIRETQNVFKCFRLLSLFKIQEISHENVCICIF